MSSTTAIKVTMTYSDGNERGYTLNNIPNDFDPSTAKAAITAFNSNASISGGTLQRTFVSNYGAPVIAISAAEVVTTEEEVIYNGN